MKRKLSLIAIGLAFVFSGVSAFWPLAARAATSGWQYLEYVDEFSQQRIPVLTNANNCKNTNIDSCDSPYDSSLRYVTGTQYNFSNGGQDTYHVDGSDPSKATYIGTTPGTPKSVNNIQNIALFKSWFPNAGQGPPSGPEDPGTKKVLVSIRVVVPQGHNSGQIAKGEKVGPLTVTLKTADGKTTVSTIQSDQSTGTSESSNSATLNATFNGVEPGDYQVCVSDVEAPCKTPPEVRKVKGAVLQLAFDTTAKESAFQADPESKAKAWEKDCSDSSGDLAWIVCPAINVVNKVLNFLFTSIIQPALETTPLADTAGNTHLRDAWAAMRNLANVVFVLIFLVIILANVLSINLDAYTIKRALPRLVAAALFVQFSYFICAFIIDTGNVVGNGVGSLVTGALGQTVTGGGASGLAGKLFEGLRAIGVGAAVGGGIAVAIFLGAAPILLVFILGLVISVVAFVFTLIFRQVILYTLIVFSPLAWAAWILPNTEKLFQFWWKNFIRLVMMFPLIMMILAGAQVVSAVGGSGDKGIQAVVAMLAPTIAFFMIPMTFKMAGGVMQGAVNIVQRGRRGVAGFAGKKVSESEWAKSEQQRGRDNKLAVGRGIASFGAGGTTLPGRIGRRVLTGAAKPLTIIGGIPTSAVGTSRGSAQAISDYGKELDVLPDATPIALQDAIKDPSSAPPALQKYVGTREGRLAIVAKLDKDEMLDSGTMAAIKDHGPEEYGAALRIATNTFTANPTMVARDATTGALSIAKNPDGTNKTNPDGSLRTVAADAASRWTGIHIRDKVQIDAFKQAAGDATTPGDEAAAQALVDGMSAITLGQVFDGSNAAFSSVEKRQAIVDMFKAHASIRTSPKGAALLAAIKAKADATAKANRGVQDLDLTGL